MKEKPKNGDYVYLVYNTSPPFRKYLVKIGSTRWEGTRWHYQGVLIWLDDDGKSGLEVGHDNIGKRGCYSVYKTATIYKGTTLIESILVLEVL